LSANRGDVRAPGRTARRPLPGQGTPMPPTDLLINRFTGMVMVNGPAWKGLIEEEYGDGIMGEAILTW
jgi:cyanate lyase